MPTGKAAVCLPPTSAPPPRPRRAVGDFQGGDVQPGNGDGAPEVGAGQQGDLLFQGHLPKEFVYPSWGGFLFMGCSLHWFLPPSAQ